MKTFPKIILRKGKEKPLLRGHPWVFSGAIARIEGEFAPGDEGEAYSAEGQFLGVGHLNPNSQIVFRLLSEEKGSFGLDRVKERIAAAARLRERAFQGKTEAYRLVNGEGDFLPGLILDRYGENLVLQILTAGMERMKPTLVDLLVQEVHPRSIFERSDVATRKDEGLPESRGLLYGKEVPDRIDIREEGCIFRVDVKGGQKTGFYLDQRDSRCGLSDWSRGKTVLDCFSYSGGFAIHAARGGALEITLIDSSEEALGLAGEHFEVNGLQGTPHRLIRGDSFEVLRDLKGPYDIVILDPPPFARKKSHVEKAARGYKDLHLQALRLLGKEGLLFCFSCSHHLGPDLFQKIVFSAAADAKRTVQVLGRRGHPIDHPFSLFHPEGEYLKGLVCRVV